MARLGTVALGALVAALASCGASAAQSTAVVPPPRHPPACGPAQAATLAFSARARVYSRGGVVFGCAGGPGGRSFRLGTLDEFRHSHLDGLYAVAGDIAAYGVVFLGVDTSPAEVLVKRLTDGDVLGTYPATEAPFGESFSSVGSLVVKSDGAAAWIGRLSSIGEHGPTIQVLAARASASTPDVLDSGSAIEQGSLRLNGSTLSWRHGGATRHATLG